MEVDGKSDLLEAHLNEEDFLSSAYHLAQSFTRKRKQEGTRFDDCTTGAVDVQRVFE